MTDLQSLLERAVDDPAEVDIAADLRRGHRAQRRRRNRLAAGTTGGLVALGVLGVVGASVLPGHRHEVIAPSDSASGDQLLHTQFYDVPQAPAGWELVGGNANNVVYRQTGDSEVGLMGPFQHAILIYLEDKSDPVHVGPAIPYDGRDFYEWGTGGEGLDSMSVQQPDGDWLRMQYPNSAGFSSDDMRAFLDAVVVKDGARGTKG